MRNLPILFLVLTFNTLAANADECIERSLCLKKLKCVTKAFTWDNLEIAKEAELYIKSTSHLICTNRYSRYEIFQDNSQSKYFLRKAYHGLYRTPEKVEGIDLQIRTNIDQQLLADCEEARERLENLYDYCR